MKREPLLVALNASPDPDVYLAQLSMSSASTRGRVVKLSTLTLIHLSLISLMAASLAGCPSKKTEPDMGAAGFEVGGEVGGDGLAGSVAGDEVEDACADRADCARSECADAPICRACESGGYCLYSGTLKVYGTVLSSNGQLISDLVIKATCGDAQVETSPGAEGRYELNITANQCNQLVILVERISNTEGYVPNIRRIQMPPPVNTINHDFKLVPGEEIRCDETICKSRRAYESYNSNKFATGYAYNSSDLRELEIFGSVFESVAGELLWLHRFAYYDFRDNQSQTLRDIFFEGTEERYALSRLNFDTRAWIADLNQDLKIRDYHSQPYSIYYDDNERWSDNLYNLTDPNIDPDNDGFYGGIEMNAYSLNVQTGQWEPLVSATGETLYARVVAEVERGYDTHDDDDFEGTPLGNSALYSPTKAFAFVPEAYLQGVQTTGDYGPGYLERESIGEYRSDYSAIPLTGSGLFAVGQPIPKACWIIRVVDECQAPVFGAPIEVRGVKHGYYTEAITGDQGVGCVEVGRSESTGFDFNGNGLSNELFDVEVKVRDVIGNRSIRKPMPQIQSTPIHEGTCRDFSSCDELVFRFSGCQQDQQ